MDKAIFLKKKIAEKLRMLRAKHGWSQEVLAELSGTHRNYIGHLERGKFVVGLVNLQKIANAFGISIVDFFDEQHFTTDSSAENLGDSVKSVKTENQYDFFN